MIVKIKDEGTGWVLFDDAKNIRYDTTSVDKFHPSLGEEFEGEVHFVGIDEHLFIDGVQDACLIEFVRNDIDYAVFFGTIAYLCNDQGKTVDKVLPNVHQTRRNQT